MPNIVSAYSATGVAPPTVGGTVPIPGFYVSSDIRSPRHVRTVRTVARPRKSRSWSVSFLPRIRVTQSSIETVWIGNPNLRITQVSVEAVVRIGTVFFFYPPAAGAGAVTVNPVVNVVGGGIVLTQSAGAGAVTVPGPRWSVTVFGALAFVGSLAPQVPDPSYDIRPGRKIVGAVTQAPWLGDPFNAVDNFVNAAHISGTILPYVVRGNTAGFTLEPGEPQPSSGVVSSTGWFTFTPATSGYYQFDLSGSLYPTSIAVYQELGTGLGGLSEVGSNQSVRETNLYVYLQAGTTYYIQIGSQGPASAGNTFQFQVSYASLTCKPSQCEGSVVANFWSGWNGTGSPGVVGGFGGTPEVARSPAPMGWSSITVHLTLDSSTNPNAIWYLAWEIHDVHDQLLGGARGGFNSITSWQDKMACGVGGTVSTTLAYTTGFGGGGDTMQAAWFVIYGFPTDPGYGAPLGHIHGQATYNGTCFIPGVAGLSRSWAWWT